MIRVTIHEAKTTLSKLIARAEAGEEIVIARGDKPVAVLKKYEADSDLAARRRAGAGSFAGSFPTPPDSAFFDPLPEDELRLWEGGGDA